MRKIFRMGYEPCKGDCYAWGDVLPIDDLDPEKRAAVKTKLLDLHRPMCGNAALRYGVDFDEHRRLFIAYFYHYGAVETFCAESMLSVVDELADSALAHFRSEQHQKELSLSSGLGRDACAYGTDEELSSFIDRSARSMQ